jgi:hypothetical protein
MAKKHTAQQISQFRVEFHQSIQHIRVCLDEFIESFSAEETFPIWLNGYQDSVLARQEAVRVMGQITYEHEQGHNESVTAPGLAGVSAETVELAVRLNEAKQQIEALSVKWRKVMVKNSDGENVSLVQDAFSQAGLPRIHRVQLYRKLVILDSKPDRVGFFQAHSRSVAKLDHAGVERLLRRQGGDDLTVRMALGKLNSVPFNEPLAHVKVTPSHVRANISWRKKGQIVRMMRHSSMPILYVSKDADVLPLFSPPGEPDAERPRLRPLDAKLEEMPFLDLINVYRYRELDEEDGAE